MSDQFTTLLDQLNRKAHRNYLRGLYYDSKRAPIDLGMMLPPQLANRLGSVLGWPAKAVDALAQRVYLQGFAADPENQTAVDELARLNRLESQFQQAATSALEHSVSWLVTTMDEADEYPVITTRDALSGTGIWNHRTHRLDAFLSVAERGDDDKPTAAILYTPERIIQRRWSQLGGWRTVDDAKNILGVVPVEPLAYSPRLDRPFGRSRISRPVMSITDMAVRTVIRAEVGAEFYSTPQRWLMGADKSAFGTNDTWRILVGRIMALADDEDATNPRAEVGQFPQISMQPHMDQLRSLAQLFSGETSIPVSSLGISIDSNPTSADSYAASREDIIGEAESCIREWRGALARTMGYALELAEVAPQDSNVQARFRDPRYTSKAAAADAFVKVASVMPWMAESDTALELLGYDETTVERLKADRRRAVGRAALAGFAALPDAGDGVTG